MKTFKMENNNDSDKMLIPFLRNLADSIEQRQLLPRQLQRIGDFFMSYKFQEQAIRDNDNSEQQPREFSQDELFKFIVLGWYIYCCILDNKVITDNNEESLD
jgi:hypothetical protein